MALLSRYIVVEMRCARVVRAPLLAASFAWGQSSLGPSQFNQDLQAVVTQLPSLHINLFFQTSQADFIAAAQQL